MSAYLLGHQDSVLRSHRWRTAENSAGYLLPYLEPGMRVLDVGCGPGTITSDLAAIVGRSGQVLGVDASAEVVERARDAGAGTDNLRFEVRDVLHLDLPDGSFDVVHAHQVLQHLQDPVAALREMRRVTRPGGLVAVREADYAAMSWYPSNDGLRRWSSVYRRTARHLGAEPDAGRRLLAWALRAGFHDVRPSASVWCFATPDDRQWWGELQADRMTSSSFSTHALAAGLASEKDLNAMAAGWRRWAAAPDAWFTIVNGEVLCRVEGMAA